MADVKNMNIVGILGILGAILMVICVFLAWGSIELTLLGETETYAFSGWDLYSDAEVTSILGQSITISDFELTEYSYAPLVALICGVIGIITAILPRFLDNGLVNKVLGIVSFILAIVAVIIMVLYMTDLSYEDGIMEIATSVKISASYGLYIGIVGAVLMIIGGLSDVVFKKSA